MAKRNQPKDDGDVRLRRPDLKDLQVWKTMGKGESCAEVETVKEAKARNEKHLQ